jgi:histidine ammonia-lyase
MDAKTQNELQVTADALAEDLEALRHRQSVDSGPTALLLERVVPNAERAVQIMRKASEEVDS